MSAVLLSCLVQLLLLLMQEVQQVLNTRGHVHIPVTQELYTFNNTHLSYTCSNTHLSSTRSNTHLSHHQPYTLTRTTSSNNP